MASEQGRHQVNGERAAASRGLSRWPRCVSRASALALTGALLALGAPLGLLLLRMSRAKSSPSSFLSFILVELPADPWTYGYVGLSTLVAFTLFGLFTGRQADLLDALSDSDPLTRLCNRRGFERQLHEHVVRAARSGRAVSLLLLDLDHLKQINDLEGHRAGDLALERVADAIRIGSRRTDVAARWGGDEFALLAYDTPRAVAQHLAERIRVLSADHLGARGSVSVGVATCDAVRSSEAADSLIWAADDALYDAKRSGRNRVVMAGVPQAAAAGKRADTPVDEGR